MYAQSQPAQGKPLSAYDIYIQENIARREALRVKPHPYTPKNEPIVTAADEIPESFVVKAIAETPVQPKTREKKVCNKPVADTDSKPEDIAEPVKSKSGKNKGRNTILANKPLQTRPRAGPL